MFINKKKVNIAIVFCLLLVNSLIDINGQYENLEFDNYTTNEGLSNGYVNTILQDYKGFIWIGTQNGLNRFDGLSFKIYQFDATDSTTISGIGVNALVEDSLKNLWVMTSNKLCFYNRKSDNFSRKVLKANNAFFNNIYITACLIDKKGFLWVCSPGFIFRFKIYNNPQIFNNIIDAEYYQLNEPDIKLVNRTSIHSLLEDNDGIVWVTSYSNNLFFFDELNKKFVAHPIEHPEKSKFSDEHKTFIKDSKGNFIITIEWNGLLIWNRKQNIFTLYKPNGTNTGPFDNLLFCPIELNDTTIWIGSRINSGINIFNQKSKKFNYYLNNVASDHSLNSNKIAVIIKDNTGNIWAGGNNGLNKYSPGKQKFKRFVSSNKPDGLSFNNILCFAESKNGNVWIGTDGGGLNLLDRKTTKFSQFINDPKNLNSISSNAIISVYETHDGKLFMGTFNGGLAEKDGNRFKSYMPDSENKYAISFRHIWYVFEDSRKNLWVATLDHGLDLFDRKTQRFYNYQSINGDSTHLVGNSLLSIFEDSKQQLYITSYEGVSIIDLKKYNFSELPLKIEFKNLKHIPGNENSLSSNGVFCVNEDMDNNIWFGTISTGLDKYDPQSGRFTNYTANDGIPGKAVSTILIDKNNYLWLATDKGLAKFNPKTKEIRVFDRLDGLQNTNFHGRGIKTKDGEMFIGGPDGFNSFFPERIKYNTNKPIVIITGLKIFNKPVKVNDRINNKIILTNTISETKELTISYKENYFGFDFIALDYTIPVKNQYAYMMIGFDKEWIKNGTKHEASYTNLDPGKYTFRVIACNNDGYWNEEGASIKLTILPPLWQTWWFKLIIFLCLVFIVSLFLIKAINKIRHLANQTILDERNQLKTLINNIPDQIFIKDTNSRFLLLNDSTVAFMGGKSEKEFIGKTDYNFYPKEIANIYFNQEQEILSTGIPLINEEKSSLINNITFIYSITKCPIKNTKGVTIGLVGIIRNITGQKMAQLEIIRQSEELKNYNIILSETNVLLEERQQNIEEQAEELKITNDTLLEHQSQIEQQAKELLAQRDQLSLLNTTKDKLFSILAHDLRSPFNALIGYSELLIKNLKKYPIEKIESQLNHILNASKQTFYMLNNLLEWSRSQREVISFNPEQIKITEYLALELKILKQQALRKNISLVEKYLGAERIVNADPNLIGTVFRNLIANAIKYSFKDSSVQITISFRDNEMLFSVKDAGTGIDPEVKENLFKINNIASVTGTMGEKGTGLGLLICADFISKHKGKIWVESELNIGSEFCFTIPYFQ